jgi:Zn-dependent protease
VPIEQILVLAPVLLFSIVAHEYAHAEAAYRQGDQTAYMLGRLTLNPLKHIDPFMTVIFPLVLIWINAPFVFGAAKPVPVNPRNYRSYVRGDIIVSLAGIATNLILFVVSALVFALVGLLGRAVPVLDGSLAILQQMMVWGMRINLVLAFFNLIPIPPLDGSHVLKFLLPPAAGLRFRQLYALGFIPIMLVVWFLPGVVGVFLWPASRLMGLATAAVGGLTLPGGWPL